jgi:hypothetical protein
MLDSKRDTAPHVVRAARRICCALGWVVNIGMTAPVMAQARVAVDRPDQLPVHEYRVSVAVSKLIADDSAFARLVREVRDNVQADLRTYDIRDHTTLGSTYLDLEAVAMAQGRWDDALAYLDSARSVQDKASARLTMGLADRALVAAKRGDPATYRATYAAAFRRELDALPYDSVDAALKVRRAGWDGYSPELITGFVEQDVDPAAAGGSISHSMAISVISVRHTLREIGPLRDVIVEQLSAVIAEHAASKPDIFAAREVTLGTRDPLTPVTVAIWDGGTDISLFPGRVWTNPREVPGNGKDDDQNGWVDDVHGIAFTWDERRTSGVLRPVTIPRDTLERYKRLQQGLNDLNAGTDSPAAREMRQVRASLTKDQMTAFSQGLNYYFNYVHGTLVAGVAARGNPAIRILVARGDNSTDVLPPLPTQRSADADARAARETIAYLRAAGVRVVNISGGSGPSDNEDALAAHNAGGTAAERRALARKYFDTFSDAFKSSIAASPAILFVASAGNTGSDTRNNEHIPASYDLPNVISVGAVDRSGMEAYFTSYGKVDVYANGVEVESVVPGGDKQRWSGTSMSAPQVTNLAAKLLAAHPSLTVAELKRLIIEGADVKQASGGQTIRLLNPARSFELANKHDSNTVRR